MYVEGRHMCRNPYPLDAMATDVITSGFHEKLDGLFDFTIHIPESTQIVDGKPQTEYRDQNTPQVQFTVKWAHAR